MMRQFANAAVSVVAVMLFILGTCGALTSEPGNMLTCGAGLLGIGFVMRKRLSNRTQESEPEWGTPESFPAASVAVADRRTQAPNGLPDAAQNSLLRKISVFPNKFHLDV